ELRALPRPSLRSRFRGPRTLHRLSLPQLRVCAERDRAGVHHAPDVAIQRSGRDAVREDTGPRRRATPIPRARLGLPWLAILTALIDSGGWMEQRAQHDTRTRQCGARQLLGGRSRIAAPLARLDRREQGVSASYTHDPGSAGPREDRRDVSDYRESWLRVPVQ